MARNGKSVSPTSHERSRKEAFTRTLPRAYTAEAFILIRCPRVGPEPAASGAIAFLIGQSPPHVVNEHRLEGRLHLPQMEHRALEPLEPAQHLADHVVLLDHNLELDRSGRRMRVVGNRTDAVDLAETVHVLPRRADLELEHGLVA